MKVIQCQFCQMANEESSQFCRECGGRLQPAPAPAQPGPAFVEPQAAAPEPPKRARLRSPILGGGSDDDDEAPSPSFKRVKSGQPDAPMNQSLGNTGRRGLRSPLLGGDEDMDEEDVQPRGKAGFGGFSGGSSGKQKKTEFPHRQHDPGEVHDQGSPSANLGTTGNLGSTGNQKNPGARGLRSPLLGGSGDADDYDDEPQGRGKSRPTKPGRLRSPILGGGGGGNDGYVDDDYEEEAQEIDDPTVLRSPLLAVRTPKAHAPQAPQAPAPQIPAPQPPAAPAPQAAPMPQPQVASQPNYQVNAPQPVPINMQVPESKPLPFVQGPYTQASGGGAPNFALSAGQLNPGPGQAMQTEMQMNPGPNFQPFPPIQGNQSGIVAPQAPSQQPAYSPPPAPAAPANYGVNSNQNAAPAQAPSFAPNQDPYSFGLGGGPSPYPPSLPAPSPGYQAPLPPAPAPAPAPPRPNQQALPASAAPTFAPEVTGPIQSKPPARATGTKFDAAEVEEGDAPKARGMRGSKLLGDVSDDPIGPLDRRSRFSERRLTPRGDRRTSIGALNKGDDLDDDREPVQTLRGGTTYPSGAGGAPNAMAPFLMAAAVMALIAKGYYMSSYITKPNIFANPATIDQIAQMLVLLAIIMYAVKASSKN